MLGTASLGAFLTPVGLSTSGCPSTWDALLALFGLSLLESTTMQWTPPPTTPTYLDPSPSAGCHSVGHSSSCLSFHPAPDLLCVWIPTRPAHARYPKPGCSRTWRHFSPWVLGPFHDPFLGLSNSLEWPMELRETVTSIYWFTV